VKSDRPIRLPLTEAEEAIDAIIAASPGKLRSKAPVRRLNSLGYPTNARALPWVLAHLDKTSPAWPEVVQYVRNAGADVMVPHLNNILESRDESGWEHRIEQISLLLEELGQPFAAGCAVTLARILAHR
jgi:hypothetical protein